MKVFCMDAHISVVADFKAACPDIEVVDWCLSSHAWVLNRQKDTPKHLNWMALTPEMIQAFQREYDDFLSTFDAFFVGHVTAFAMIYEKYNRPILMANSCRVDIPFCWSNDAMRKELVDCLQRLHAKGHLYAFSNNRADQLYTKKVTGLDTQLLPSLCLYTGIQYKPTRKTFLCYYGDVTHPLVEKKPAKFEWSDLGSYRGIIHIPYEVSTMSMFEHFTAGLPLFFPSLAYWQANPNIQSMSAYWKRSVPAELQDLTNPARWMELSDIYTTFKSPNTYYFDSMEHLAQLLESFEYVPESRQDYIQSVQKTWKKAVTEIVSGKFWTQEPRHLCYNRLPLLANVIYDGNYTGSGVKAQHNYPHKQRLSRGDVVFVKTDYLEWFLQNRKVEVPITLVTGVSDLSPTPLQCERILAHPHIVRWIGCNIPVSHPKIQKYLIGVGEPERANGKHDILLRLHASRIPWDDKSDELCIPFFSPTHASRTMTSTLPRLPFEEYMQAIGKHKFVLCARGNGIDTHRFCEILLMGSVPVLEHSPLDDLYTQFPCKFVGEDFQWDETKYQAFLDMFWLRCPAEN